MYETNVILGETADQIKKFIQEQYKTLLDENNLSIRAVLNIINFEVQNEIGDVTPSEASLEYKVVPKSWTDISIYRDAHGHDLRLCPTILELSVIIASIQYSAVDYDECATCDVLTTLEEVTSIVLSNDFDKLIKSQIINYKLHN